MKLLIITFITTIETMQQNIRRNKLLSKGSDQINRNLFRKRNNKPQRLTLNLKQADENIVYRALKHQRDTKSILDFILEAGSIKEMDALKRRAKSHMGGEIARLKSASPFKNYSSSKQMETFKEKAVKIVVGTMKVKEELEMSKRRIRILDKFNRRVNKYCSYLPQNPQDEEENESNIANDQLIKLCNQDFFPTQNLHKRAHSLMHYEQPKIPAKRIKKLKERYRLNTTTLPSSATEPFQRLLTLNF